MIFRGVVVVFELDSIMGIRRVLTAGAIVDICIIINLIVVFVNLKFL